MTGLVPAGYSITNTNTRERTLAREGAPTRQGHGEVAPARSPYSDDELALTVMSGIATLTSRTTYAVVIVGGLVSPICLPLCLSVCLSAFRLFFSNSECLSLVMPVCSSVMCLSVSVNQSVCLSFVSLCMSILFSFFKCFSANFCLFNLSYVVSIV